MDYGTEGTEGTMLYYCRSTKGTILYYCRSTEGTILDYCRRKECIVQETWSFTRVQKVLYVEEAVVSHSAEWTQKIFGFIIKTKENVNITKTSLKVFF